jgi:hypothetical protein
VVTVEPEPLLDLLATTATARLPTSQQRTEGPYALDRCLLLTHTSPREPGNRRYLNDVTVPQLGPV